MLVIENTAGTTDPNPNVVTSIISNSQLPAKTRRLTSFLGISRRLDLMTDAQPLDIHHWLLNASFSDLETLTLAIPSHLIPHQYLASLTSGQRIVALKTIILCWNITSGTHAPREIQLRAAIATSEGSDSFIYASTGSGKTLCIALNIWLDWITKPATITITISPLKRLQITQVCLHSSILFPH